MTELFENSYTPPAEPVDVNDGEVHVNIRICVFFDGTSNNRVNTESRVKNLDVYKKDEAKHKKKSDSYENDFTNVAKMEPHVNITEPPPGYNHVLKTYIEGPGTDDNEGDSMVGYGIGLGNAGVRAKVKKGRFNVVTEIDNKLMGSDVVIDLLTIDVFGFSRGAAGARNFIHEAMHGDNSIAERLKEEGYTVGKVEVCFAGLYDTVSSHGLIFSNDTATLSLDAIKDAKSVLHLVAAEEHRKNFSLTDIQSAKGKGREVYLPGAHSDVGGSYRDGKPEAQVLYEGSDVSFATAYRSQLLDVGWGTEDEITLKVITGVDGDYATLSVSRPTLSNHYSKIPLNLMARAARNKGIVFREVFDDVKKIPENLTELTTAQEKINAYIDSATSKASAEEQAAHWLNNKEPWLTGPTGLRRKYLHLSAKDEFGLKLTSASRCSST